MLIFQLAQNPALMNVEYLRYFIGPPEEQYRLSGPEKHYVWYDSGRQVKYQLDQVARSPGMVTESSMVINLDGTGLTFKKLKKELAAAAQADPSAMGFGAAVPPVVADGAQALAGAAPGGGSPFQGYGAPSGQDFNAAAQSNGMPGQGLSPYVLGNGDPALQIKAKKFFDYNGHATELFSFAPNTFLTFDCVPNSFKLNAARIVYRGDALPAPSPAEMQMAVTAFSERARLAGEAAEKTYKKNKPGKKAKPSKDKNAVASAELMPMLIQRVRSQPLDPEAHLMLAQALKRSSHISEAISEYKIALAMSGDMPDVRDQALLGLKQMMILPDDMAVEQRQLQIMDNGRMRVAPMDKKPKKKDTDDSDN